MNDTDQQHWSTTVPATIFHLTDKKNLSSIMKDGLTGAFGNYFASSVDHAARFLAFRPHLWSDDKAEVLALEVSTEGLNVREGTDHSPAIFGEQTTSWVVWEVVPPSAIVHVHEVVLSFGGGDD